MCHHVCARLADGMGGNLAGPQKCWEKWVIMENIAFVLWVCFWPLTCLLGNFLSAKTRQLTGERKLDLVPPEIGLFELAIWVIVAIALFPTGTIGE